MTRITNFGRKRTYVEAGFTNDPVNSVEINVPSALEDATVPSKEDNITTKIPPKKKRKRTKQLKAHTRESEIVGATHSGTVQGGDEEAGATDNLLERKTGKLKKFKSAPKDQKSKAALWRAEQSELRRQKRTSDRQNNTICFACRKMGHAAKDCPVSPQGDALKDKIGSKHANSVGICYRCGSKRHTLSRCKKPTDPSDPLPFAACFVCAGKGHLASSCPQNKARGIYPNGGSCKLCGDTTHLAKNCGLLQKDAVGNNPILIGPAMIDINMGADEDDFHTFKRRTAQIQNEEKKEEKAKQRMDIKAGAHSGVVKAFGKSPVAQTKKVVYF